MIPFKVYDRDKKQMWIVLNYHPQTDSYLIALQSDSQDDGELRMMNTSEIVKFNLVEFITETDS